MLNKPIWERDYWPVYWRVAVSNEFYGRKLIDECQRLYDENEQLRTRLALLERTNRAIIKQTGRSGQ